MHHAREEAQRTIPRFDLSEFVNLAEFGVFGLGDRVHPGVIIITSENQNYCIFALYLCM
jgi:hypothetical protein